MNQKYNLFVIIDKQPVLRCEDNIFNRIYIKRYFDNYKLEIR